MLNYLSAGLAIAALLIAVNPAYRSLGRRIYTLMIAGLIALFWPSVMVALVITHLISRAKQHDLIEDEGFPEAERSVQSCDAQGISAK